MRPCVRSSPWFAVVGVLLVFAAACAAPSPEERVAAIRSRYHAELNPGGFSVRQTPLAGAEGEAGRVRTDVLLDLQVWHESAEKLPGVTVDIAMQDPGGREKGHWRVWTDTSRLEKGPGMQISHVLEDVPYQEGDGFYAELRRDIPAEERGEYREFSVAFGAP